MRRRSVEAERVGAADALDVGTERPQLLDEALVPAVDVVDAPRPRSPRQPQACEHEARTGADVGGLHLGAGELLDTRDEGVVAVDADLRA